MPDFPQARSKSEIAASIQNAEQEALAKLGADPDAETDDDDGVEFDDTTDVSQEGSHGDAGATESGGEQPPAPGAGVSGSPGAAVPAGEQPPPPSQGQPPPPATAPTDPFAETVDVEYDDVDSGEKYVVRAPKSYADKVKRGFQARSYTDRKLSSLGRNRAWIEPLMESGVLDRSAPYLQRLLQDPELQNVLATAMNRRDMGLPLTFADQAALVAAGQPAGPQAGQPAAPAPFVYDETAERNRLAQMGYDSYMIDAIIGQAKPVAESLAATQASYTALKDDFTQFRSRYETQQTESQRQQQQVAQMQQVGAAARSQLMSFYPNELNDQTPRETWDRLWDYANRSGMLQNMGFSPGTIVAAYQRMREETSPTRTLAPSQALATVAAVEADARRQAAAASAAVGAAAATGGGTPQQAPPPKPRVKIDRFKTLPGGKRVPKTATELARDMTKAGAS